MIKSASSLKGKIKNIAHGDPKMAEAYMRIFFMERLLERVSVSEYREKFILKGGMLAASLIGVNLRTTMDIDTSVKGLPLNEEDAKRFISDIASIDIGDGVSFEIKQTERIMDEFDYPGVRLYLEGKFEAIRQRIKIDISTDDVITPAAVEYEYKLLFEDRVITLFTYNTETFLAEKLQTILSRGTANTRLRDFYDIHMISNTADFSIEILRDAFRATCQKRETIFSKELADQVLADIRDDSYMIGNWGKFIEKNSYASEARWEEAVISTQNIVNHLF